MRKILKPFLYFGLLLWFPIYRLLRKLHGPTSPEAFRILCLHHVTKSQLPALERIIQYLQKAHGIITPEEAEERMRGIVRKNKTESTPYLLSFDDGFKSNATFVRELLDKYGIKSIFFICPGLLDLSPDRQRKDIASLILQSTIRPEDVTDDMLMMSWAEAKSLIDFGHTLGAHSLCHQRLSRLADDCLTKEIVLPIALIKEKAGVTVKWFSYPFGDNDSINSRSFKIISRNYEFCCNVFHGTNSSQTHPLFLHRTGISFNSPFFIHKIILDGAIDYLYSRKTMKGVKLIDTDISNL